VATPCETPTRYCPIFDRFCPIINRFCPIFDRFCPIINRCCPIFVRFCPVFHKFCPIFDRFWLIVKRPSDSNLFSCRKGNLKMAATMGARQGVAMDSLMFRSGPTSSTLLHPAGMLPLNRPYSRAGDLRPSPTPLDTRRRTPLGDPHCFEIWQKWDSIRLVLPTIRQTIIKDNITI
jgi:hypothetical protein